MKKGYISIFMTAILGVISVMVVLSLLTISASSIRMNNIIQEGKQARYNAISCAELGVYGYINGSGYDSFEQVSLDEHTCYIDTQQINEDLVNIRVIAESKSNTKRYVMEVSKLTDGWEVTDWDSVQSF
jgi:hypothetical protein